jgi:hypothetical protein
MQPSPKLHEPVKNGVFWEVTLCGSCKNRPFGGTQRLHNQGDKNRWTKNKLALFLVHRFLSLWWRRRYVPPKRRFLQEPHGLTSQNTTFFIVTAVKTSNLTYMKQYLQPCNVPSVPPYKHSKAIPVTGRRGLKGCEMLRIPHCQDNRLIDVGEVSQALRAGRRFTRQKHFSFCLWYSFLLDTE